FARSAVVLRSARDLDFRGAASVGLPRQRVRALDSALRRCIPRRQAAGAAQLHGTDPAVGRYRDEEHRLRVAGEIGRHRIDRVRADEARQPGRIARVDAVAGAALRPARRAEPGDFARAGLLAQPLEVLRALLLLAFASRLLLGFAFRLGFGFAFRFRFGFALGLLLGFAFRRPFGLAFRLRVGFLLRLGFGFAFRFFLGLALRLFLGLAPGLLFGLTFRLRFGLLPGAHFRFLARLLLGFAARLLLGG